MSTAQRLQTLFLALVLALIPALGSSAPGSALPTPVTAAAQSYAQSLARSRVPAFTLQERRQLLEAAALLSRANECQQALQVRSSVWPGYTPSADEWLAQANDAVCARDGRETLGAAYQALQTATSDGQRFAALVLLARAADFDWRLGAEEALTLYRLALKHGQSAFVLAEVARLEDELQASTALRLMQVDVRYTGAEPMLCLQFNQNMPAPGMQRYADFIRVEPRLGQIFSQSDPREVCIEGAEFGARYQVTILAGLTDQDGRTLAATRSEPVSVADREPSLRFLNHLYVLPRNGGGVPILAVNTPRADLALYRIDPRNLTASEVRDGFSRDLGNWSERRLQDEFGAEVWRGQVELPITRNREQRVDLPLADTLRAETGVFVLTARPSADDPTPEWGDHATQWLVLSDLGLTTYFGRDALTAHVRGLNDALPRSGIMVQAIARNNRILASAVTDAKGLAAIPAARLRGRGGDEPVYLFVLGADGDFNFLDLTLSPFDLSDRGVAGRHHGGAVDAYLYTERGVYRPGERVHLGALLRDDTGTALTQPLPITFRFRRPDDTIATEVVAPVAVATAAGLMQHFDLPASARTGRWRIQALLDPERAPIGEIGFQVQAILPPRIEVALDSWPEQPLTTVPDAPVAVQADYLFGAPAAELLVRAELALEPHFTPFPQWSGYRFGPLDTPEGRTLTTLPEQMTDATGRAELALHWDTQAILPWRSPVRMELRAEVVDVDGRAAVARASQIVTPEATYLGVRALGSPGSGGQVMFDQGTSAQVEWIAVTGQGEIRTGPVIRYRLIEEIVDYQWYRDYGSWQYRRQVRTREVARGEQAATAEPASLSFALPNGRYRLDLTDPESGAASGIRIEVGWGSGPARDETPDRLRVRHDRPSYPIGTPARLTIEGSFDGPGQVVLATDRVLNVIPITLRDQRAEIDIAVDESWGGGVYALVTAFRPDNPSQLLGPRRAIGVVWLAVDTEPRKIPLRMTAPTLLRTEETLTVNLSVADLLPAETVYVTVAAVDEGLLQLTEHPAPQPLQYFFGQRRLGLELRDIYGRLLEGRIGQPGRIGSGAGAPGTESGLEPPVVLLAKVSDVITLDASGQGQASFALPPFEGRVRLHAVAWSATRLGQASSAVVVRDPVAVHAALPRFLGGDDRAQATVTLFNTEAPAGQYQLHWETAGALQADHGQTPVTLKPGSRQVLPLTLTATHPGRGQLKLHLTGPNDFRVERHYTLTVTPAFPLEVARQPGRLAPGSAATVGGAQTAGWLPTTIRGQLSVDTRPQWDLPGLIAELEEYPYGCAEQVASRAFALLSRPALRTHSEHSAELDRHALTAAVNQLLERQLDNGAFTLWGGPWLGADYGDAWVSVYVLDFLAAARDAGIEVPDFAWRRGLRWLQQLVDFPATEDAQQLSAQVYALHLLARHGQGRPDNARYLFTTVGQSFPSGISAARLGAALILAGDHTRGRQAIAWSLDLPRVAGLNDYGSLLRDRADILRLALAYAPEAIDTGKLANELAEVFATQRWLSTQEQAALIRAAVEIGGQGAALNLTVGTENFRADAGPLTIILDPRPLATKAGLSLRNLGTEAAWFNALLQGHPTTAPLAYSEGLTIQRELFRLDGTLVIGDNVTQGEVLVAVLSGHALTDEQRHPLLLVDPLPAGLEAEVPGLAGSRHLDDLTWLGTLSPLRYADALDDRFAAAVDLELDQRSFRVAYLLRAVTPGSYRFAPARVEDMYSPRFRAQGQSAWLSVAGSR